MRKFDYVFLTKLVLPDRLSSLLACLHQLQAEERRLPAVMAENVAKAVEQLEGRVFPGYALAIKKIDEGWADVPLSIEGLFSLVQLALPGTAWESEKKSLVLDQAFSAYLNSENAGVAPLLRVPCLMLDLLCIAPFSTASTAAALLLARHLLYRSGFVICGSIPFEEMILRYRYFYQQAFLEARKHWEENDSDYLPYIEMVLSLLYLGSRVSRLRPGSRRGAKRASIEMLVLSSALPISKAEICQALPHISPTTVEAVLGTMVRNGMVRKVGASRAARYIRA